LTANNPSQQKRLAALEPLVVHKLAELEETITLRQTKGFEAAMAAVESDRGKQVMDEIRQAINDMKGEEEQFVMRRRSQAEALAQTSKAVIIAGDLLALVIISGAGLLLLREMAGRTRAEEAARKHAHELAETNNELQSEIGERKRVEDELRRTETFLASLVDNIPDMIFVKDPAELRFVLFNKAAEELLGYTRSEMIGKNDYDFFPRDEADFFTNKDREVLTTGQLLDIPEESIQTRHKGGRLLHTKKIPLLDEQGSPPYLVGISEDITERKRLEKEKEALIVQLQSSLARLKTLEGILPICAHCKKIRDEQGEWQPVEVYVGVRTNVGFSHGICPACLDKHYPQFGSGDLSPRT
jgi:PAS domain S-box-containing protein